MIPIRQICTHYNVELTFIQELQEYGLITVITMETEQYLLPDHMQLLEKMIRLHYELEINLEGIEAITHMLQRIETMQGELQELRNKVGFYEGE